jgi:D-tyrosyl-tRNA(Tyr) deacylase
VRALLQRVSSARVSVDGETLGQIGPGWAVLLGVGPADSRDVAERLAEKVAYLRCFDDESGKMNRSVVDVAGQVLVVSQFTLYADTSRGRRPSYISAAPPSQAEPLVEHFADSLRGLGLHVSTGRFGAHMLVSIENDGPVTIWLDTDNKRSD